MPATPVTDSNGITIVQPATKPGGILLNSVLTELGNQIKNKAMTPGTSGYSGFSGYSGAAGTSGLSGVSGYSGTSGASGTSGWSGFSGQSGRSGYSGVAGLSGYSGFSGISGWSGFSGFSGISGFSGRSGYSCSIGTTGTSGYSGFSGVSGWSGFSGVSGYSGSAASNLVTSVAGRSTSAMLRSLDQAEADELTKTYGVDLSQLAKIFVAQNRGLPITNEEREIARGVINRLRTLQAPKLKEAESKAAEFLL